MGARTPRLLFTATLGAAIAVWAAHPLPVAGQTSANSDEDRQLLGTWKLNLAKSKFDPGPPPMSETRVFEAWETDGVKMTITVVGADGTRGTLGFSNHYDGKDYKLTGSPDFDTVAAKRVGANTVAFTLKRSGKVVETGRDVVSKKGKVRTLTATGMTSQGQKVNVVAVYDKQ